MNNREGNDYPNSAGFSNSSSSDGDITGYEILFAADEGLKYAFGCGDDIHVLGYLTDPFTEGRFACEILQLPDQISTGTGQEIQQVTGGILTLLSSVMEKALGDPRRFCFYSEPLSTVARALLLSNPDTWKNAFRIAIILDPAGGVLIPRLEFLRGIFGRDCSHSFSRPNSLVEAN